MDYEKLYKEALERARQVHSTNVDENKKSTEYIFPELKESEDEKNSQNENENAHWQDVKEHAAIAIMQAIVSSSVNKINEDNVHFAIKNSVVLAKGLVEQLKQDKK